MLLKWLRKTAASLARLVVVRATYWALLPETKLSIRRRMDAYILALWSAKAATAPNPLLKRGAKYYSQNDEDGLTLEIVARIGIENGTFVEIGVGNGLENNSIVLLMLGWSGLWIDRQELAFQPHGSKRLRFYKEWVSPQNIPALIERARSEQVFVGDGPDFLSVDIDSFDLHVMRSILGQNLQPKVLVVEYNAKFPPPIRFTVGPESKWDRSDYYGCSLQSWCDLLEPLGYNLVACNVTGVNAFFVRKDFRGLFPEVPTDINKLFMPCDYNWFVQVGFRPSAKTIAHFAHR
jgi:hypothetical protein